jgi:hypothetical protein
MWFSFFTVLAKCVETCQIYHKRSNFRSLEGLIKNKKHLKLFRVLGLAGQTASN